jgi:hypothetical protein
MYGKRDPGEGTRMGRPRRVRVEIGDDGGYHSRFGRVRSGRRKPICASM